MPSPIIPSHVDRAWRGKGVVTLDLVNCTEVRSVPSPTHSSAREDVGTIAVKTQSEESDERERVRWVSAVWEALDRSVTLPSRSEMGSPTGSIRTIQSITSTSRSSDSKSGSRSTVFVPPFHSIPDVSDLHSISDLSSSASIS
ncbi:hypothetical protein BJ138DRAFT_1117127 [Hygrophoropsis aurantiaca]|uniref:Uncharacterized protein n=1 Tax=Hygrophoropsis aurantiaca TaxID=72124 RepID=A0ACB8A2K9_9AGAM|nr:hypothetical protein BJ138DRAFT_1117127 [Hygrophoropsis aurantiaca]